MFEPRVKNGQTDLLMKALLSLESTDEAYRFFEDLCTIAEIKSMAQRIEVAKMLREHATYQEIARQTGASSATISRVNRALLYGAERLYGGAGCHGKCRGKGKERLRKQKWI